MILNGKLINPGELRTPIVLKSRTVTQDAGGFASPSHSIIASVKAKWTNIYGKRGMEFLADNSYQADHSIKNWYRLSDPGIFP